MPHYIQKCEKCSTVVAQCRCPDKNKTVELVNCGNCKGIPEGDEQKIQDFMKNGKGSELNF